MFRFYILFLATILTVIIPYSDAFADGPGNASDPDETQLSKEDQRILKHGEISHGRYVAGGITGSIVGFGIGQAIQGSGRYGDVGWIFSAADGLGTALVLVSVFACVADGATQNKEQSNCNGARPYATAGLVTLVGFRIWEINDLWTVPPKINRRFEELTGRKQSWLNNLVIHPVAYATPGHPVGMGLTLSF